MRPPLLPCLPSRSAAHAARAHSPSFPRSPLLFRAPHHKTNDTGPWPHRAHNLRSGLSHKMSVLREASSLEAERGTQGLRDRVSQGGLSGGGGTVQNLQGQSTGEMTSDAG